MKLFSEIYSTYYSITEKILKKRTVTKAEIADIIRQNGFSESVLSSNLSSQARTDMVC